MICPGCHGQMVLIREGVVVYWSCSFCGESVLVSDHSDWRFA
jgi:hypothetical protein